MKKYRFKIIAAAVALSLTASGCFSDSPTVTSASSTAPQETVITTTKKAAALADEDEPTIKKEPLPLNIVFPKTNGIYTPFSNSADYDKLMNSLTGVYVLYTDRSGKALLKGASGEKSVYSSKFYSYTGSSDLTSEYDEETDTSVCSIKLRDDITFSDGEKLTADDLIFTLYALLDPAYSGYCGLSETDIVGLLNYRLSSSIAETITDEEISAALESEEVLELIKQEIIIPALRSEYETVMSLYDDTTYNVYTDAYPDPKDLLAFFISIDSSYKPDVNESADDVISDLAEMYGGNYRLFGSMYTGSEDAFSRAAEAVAIRYITESNGASCDIKSISGIEKTGEYSVRVTLNGKSGRFIDELTEVVIAPLHYYGNKNLFNISKESYGFTKGTDYYADAPHKDAPIGAGAYRFVKSENGIVTLEANESCYKGTPEISTINITMTGSSDKAIDDISGGSADVSFPNSSKETFEEIESANKSLMKIHLGISRNDGYGYIGLNADNVCINDEPFSEESIMLRKAIASAINFYKNTSVKEYYGDDDKAADYPVSTGFSLSSRDSLTKPYSTDVSGNPIYGEGMNETELYYEVKSACIGYLKAAGYGIENDKITEVPEGGKTEFTAVITGGGNENHPSFSALSKASRLLRGIGITLNVIDSEDGIEIWDELNSGTIEIWAGVQKDDLRRIYASSDYYGLGNSMNELLDKFDYAETAEEKEQAFIECALMASDGLAVEIPMYKRDSYTAFSSLRVDLSTLPENMTGCYDWTREIETLKMK